MSHLDRDATHCQPCDRFESKGIYYAHECRACGGTVYDCENCGCDHHDGGWQACPSNGMRTTCGHPACKAAERALFQREIEGTP